MPELIGKSEKTGHPSGTLVYAGEKKGAKVKITLIDYSRTHFQEKEVENIEELRHYKDKPSTTWINVNGINRLDVIEKIGKHFNLHSLLLEDIVNTEQRPKIVDFRDYLFVVLKLLYYDERKHNIKVEQISLILGLNFVISFQETGEDIFSPIRERIRDEKTRAKFIGADYLAYALIDTVVDKYFTIMEKLEERMELLEKEVVENPTQKIVERIFNLKREIMLLQKSVWPLREVISMMEKISTPLIKKSTEVYFKDVHDHTIQVIDTAEIFRDILAGMLEVYLSNMSNRMNEIMKFLTVIATIFIPLTFITGIYGMNFRHMPELNWSFGYPLVLAIILTVGISMLLYFRGKKWI